MLQVRWGMVVGLLLLGNSCTSSSLTSSPAATQRPVPENLESITAQSSNIAVQGLPRLKGKATVLMIVNHQAVTIEVDGDHAPLTAGNFVDLVERGVYDGLMFHRVIRDPEPFVVQGGDPLSADLEVTLERLGAGSYLDLQTQRPRYIPLEIQPEGHQAPIYSRTLLAANISDPPILTHRRGAIAMARSQMPDSASAQFYFALDDLLRLDGNYAVFGYVTAGMTVVDQIQPGDRIDSARVTSGLERLERPE